MNAKANNPVQSSNVQAGQILGFREIVSLPAAAREYFAQYLRNLADAIESGNRSPSGEQQGGTKGAESPCTNCQYRSECKEPCEKLEAFLPSVTAGRGSKENTTGLRVETLKDYEHTRRLDILQEYQSCKEHFTAKQWEVICLCYGQGLTQEQIAIATGKKRSAISGLLGRATDAKDRHFEQMRKEFLTVRKKQMRNDA